jgi:DNA polymerase III delta prime subunit
VQKYAPTALAEVLQNGRDCALLKEWLQSLKVDSVDTGVAESSRARSDIQTKPVARKKRKKTKLDGFIVSSEEQADELGEVSDDGETWSAAEAQNKRTVVRNGETLTKSKDTGRLRNTVIISGPHGSGKTTAVYAIARELDYEVFEINSSSRRSGKDVLDKIGDMTQNHLVQQHRAGLNAMGQNQEEVLSQDPKIGIQATMAAFFKPKTSSKTADTKSRGLVGDAQRTKAVAVPKQQKQSLILLEEADILYEEDKQFWATLLGLMSQSKRPFIITCNDENLVPIESLSLHGIFRFSPPPVDLAVDAMLLIAANEGHALKRAPIEDLYESRSRDLRASLMDLNYWCQIGVGDRRGGFDWFYSRWPRGSDLDEHGNVIRVISEDTYQGGLGWLPRDIVFDQHPGAVGLEEDRISQCWSDWSIDLGEWHESLDRDAWMTAHETPAASSGMKAAMLESIDRVADAMSSADIFSMSAFAIGDQVCSGS